MSSNHLISQSAREGASCTASTRTGYGVRYSVMTSSQDRMVWFPREVCGRPDLDQPGRRGGEALPTGGRRPDGPVAPLAPPREDSRRRYTVTGRQVNSVEGIDAPTT